MSHLARIRQQQQSWGRRALGLFVAVWMKLALQPCAMAFELAADPDCLHCPPEQMQEHGGMHGGMDHEMPCADGMSDCAIIEDLNVDARGDQTKLKDAPGDAAIAILPHEFVAPFPPPADATLLPRFASARSGAPPPLHVLHCVYLK